MDGKDREIISSLPLKVLELFLLVQRITWKSIKTVQVKPRKQTNTTGLVNKAIRRQKPGNNFFKANWVAILDGTNLKMGKLE